MVQHLQKWIIVGVLIVSASLVMAQQSPSVTNPHAELEPFTSLLSNPTLQEEPLEVTVNFATVSMPPGWLFTANIGEEGVPPNVRPLEEGGYIFEWNWLNGEAGYISEGVQLFGGQRYVIQVDYETALEYTGDVGFNPGDVRVVARVYTAEGGVTELPAIPMNGTSEEHNLEWVIETEESVAPYARIEVAFEVTWASFTGGTILKRVDLLTAPVNYKPDFVHLFD